MIEFSIASIDAYQKTVDTYREDLRDEKKKLEENAESLLSRVDRLRMETEQNISKAIADYNTVISIKEHNQTVSGHLEARLANEKERKARAQSALDALHPPVMPARRSVPANATPDQRREADAENALREAQYQEALEQYLNQKRLLENEILECERLIVQLEAKILLVQRNNRDLNQLRQKTEADLSRLKTYYSQLSSAHDSLRKALDSMLYWEKQCEERMTAVSAKIDALRTTVVEPFVQELRSVADFFAEDYRFSYFNSGNELIDFSSSLVDSLNRISEEVRKTREAANRYRLQLQDDISSDAIFRLETIEKAVKEAEDVLREKNNHIKNAGDFLRRYAVHAYRG